MVGHSQPPPPSLCLPAGAPSHGRSPFGRAGAPRGQAWGPGRVPALLCLQRLWFWLLKIFEIFYSGNFNFSKLKQMSGNTSLKSGWTSCPWGLGPKWAGSALAVGPPPAVPPACLQPVGGQACFLCIWGLAPTLSGQRARVCQTVRQFASVPAGAHHPPVHPLWGVTGAQSRWPHTALALQSAPMCVVSRPGRL